MGMTVERLGQEVSSHELSEWMAYEKVEGPLGDERADYLSGTIAATLANIHRRKNAPAYSVFDFMPFHAVEREHHANKARIAELKKQRRAVEKRNADSRKIKR